MPNNLLNRLRHGISYPKEHVEKILSAAKMVEAEYRDLHRHLADIAVDNEMAAKMIEDQAKRITAQQIKDSSQTVRIAELAAQLEAQGEENASLMMRNETLTARVAEVEGALRGIRTFTNQYLPSDKVEAIQDDDDSAAEASHEGTLYLSGIEVSDADPTTKASKLKSEASQDKLESELDFAADDTELPQGMAASESGDESPEPTLGPPAAEAEDPIPALANSLGENIHSIQPLRCAFAIQNKKSGTAIIGNPFEDMMGWAVTLDVNPGRNGPPYISLKFRIKKSQKDQPVPDKHDQCNEFSVTWRPGVLVNNKPMITDLSAWIVMNNKREAFVRGTIIPHHPDVVDLCPVSEKEKLKQLLAFSFDSQALDKPAYSATNKKPWKRLPKDIQDGLDCLCFQNCQRRFTIWFCAEPDIDTAARDWLRKLVQIVRSN